MNPVIGCEIHLSPAASILPQATTSVRSVRDIPGSSSQVILAACDECASALVETGNYERMDDGTLEMDTAIVGDPDASLAAEKGLTLVREWVGDDDDDDDDDDFDDDDEWDEDDEDDEVGWDDDDDDDDWYDDDDDEDEDE